MIQIQQLHSYLYHPNLSAYQLASHKYADENNKSLIGIYISHLHMIYLDYCMKIIITMTLCGMQLFLLTSTAV